MRSFVGTVAIAAMMAACTGNKSGNAVDASDSAEISAINQDLASAVDAEQSMMHWKGFKPGGEHFGRLPITSGKVEIADGRLMGGYVEIAMNGIIVDDLEGDMATMLKNHLENEDFFDAGVYPTSKFELTDIPTEGIEVSTLTELKGNLTLKDKTKNITIPVEHITFDAAKGSWGIKSKTFRINRADWNVQYGSKSFFSNLGDKFIEDEIELSFDLKTK